MFVRARAVHVLITTQNSIAIRLHIDQARRLDSFSKWKRTDAFVRPAFGRRKERFREQHRSTFAPGPLDFLEDRLGHDLISAAENHIERNHARAELTGLPDDVGRILILEFERRQLLQVPSCYVDMNNAWLRGRGERPLIPPLKDLIEPAHFQGFERIPRDQSPNRGRPANSEKDRPRRSSTKPTSSAGLAGTGLPAITKLEVPLRWKESTRRGGLPQNWCFARIAARETPRHHPLHETHRPPPVRSWEPD